MAFQTREQKAFSQDRTAINSTIAVNQSSVGADGKSAGTNLYSYNTYEYPIGELGSVRYPHFMIVYVNVNSKTKLVKGQDAGNKPTITNPTYQTQGQNSVALNGTSGTSASTVAANSTAGAAIASLAGGVASHKRITTAICLPMPQKIRANYSAAYGETEDVGILGALLSSISSGQGMGSVTAAGNLLAQTAIPGIVAAGAGGLQQGAASVLAKTGGKLGAAGGAVLADGSLVNKKLIEQIGSKLVGTVINKRQEQLFQKMDFRKHHFQWLFLPRSKEESDVIFQIANILKANMHPEMDQSTANSTLIMPAEFDVEYRWGEVENDRISKVATSVMTSCEIDYTAVGEFITFEGYKDPIAISLSLMFTELEPLSNSMIRAGY
jgi:hypothetical protein